MQVTSAASYLTDALTADLGVRLTGLSMRYVTVALLLLFSLAQVPQPVFDLSDRDCRDEVLISVIHEGAHVFASCASDGGDRIVRISVRNHSNEKDGPLRDFSVGFCGPSIIQASGPSGWVAKVEGDERHSVRWSLADDLVDKLGIRSGVRASGFLVRLKPGWTRSRSDSARWGDSDIVAQVTTHDCP